MSPTNLRRLLIPPAAGEGVQQVEETLKSQACMNIITKDQIRPVLGGECEFSTLRFTPTYQPGEYFSLGPAEIFVAE